MTLAYDFHLHSCLSPCGDAEMSPYNLVNMAAILGLDIIALTDHNTVGNCAAAMAVGADIGLTVVPGMELCTAEEIHVVCLFPSLACAEAFSAHVRTTLPPMKNDPEVFGPQCFMDQADNILGEEELLLITASGISIDALPRLTREYGGFCYPAHIDRSSFSVLSSFGTIDADMGFSCAEISAAGDPAALALQYPALRAMRIMHSSDAHYLENMAEPRDTVELTANTPEALIAYLQAL